MALLNADLEQLLNAFGLPAVGPRHTLANLARLCAPALRPRLSQNGQHAAQREAHGRAAPPLAPLPPAGRRSTPGSPGGAL